MIFVELHIISCKDDGSFVILKKRNKNGIQEFMDGVRIEAPYENHCYKGQIGAKLLRLTTCQYNFEIKTMKEIHAK